MAATYYEEFDSVNDAFAGQVQTIIHHNSCRTVLENCEEDEIARNLMSVAQEHMLNNPGTQAMMDFFVSYTEDVAPGLKANAMKRWKKPG